MKICYFGTYRQGYSRNKIMIAALQKVGIEVEECHVQLWHGIQDRVEIVTGGWKRPSFWWRIVRVYFKLIIKSIKLKDFDILMVGYPGQFDVFFAKILAVIRGKPLVWDVFMSIYLVSKERKLDKKNRFTINLIRFVENLSLQLPDLLLQDTVEYVRWFSSEYGIPDERFRIVSTGADDRIFSSRNSSRKDKKFLVLYYGTFIPNHGVMKIIQAAVLLRNEKNIYFEFIGDGPDKKSAEMYSIEHQLNNVRFLTWMQQEELLDYIAGADICLGAFGNTPQSLMTVQNKIYECMAMGKPIITGDSPALRNNLPDKTVILCSRDNPQDIAIEILRLKRNPTQRKLLSDKAEETFRRNFSTECLGQRMKTYFSELIKE